MGLSLFMSRGGEGDGLMAVGFVYGWGEIQAILLQTLP